MKRIFAALCALLLVPTMASAGGERISVTELREQVETRGRWTADYTDRYDRKIHVDIEPIMGQYDAVPIIIAENPRQFTEENIKNSIHGEQMKNAVTEESAQEGVQCWEYEDDQTGELTHVEAVYTVGVETVCLLSKLNVKHHIEVEITMDELDLTAAESKATYDEIKAYVLEKFGFKVSQLYIAQIKRKCGIIERKNYNQSKKEDAKVPKCPPEKEAAIMDALKHFQMIP